MLECIFMDHLEKLISVIKETRKYLAWEGNDFSWSSWNGREAALSEIDSLPAQLDNGSVPDIDVLFAPTGPIQEVSMSNGWSLEFLQLAERFDEAYANAKSGS
jgi:hypothetical protein